MTRNHAILLVILAVVLWSAWQDRHMENYCPYRSPDGELQLWFRDRGAE